MPTVELTKDNFHEVVRSNEVVLIDFWADWCGPCKSFGPIFEDASGRHPDATFAKCDTEAERELAATFQIRAIPTLAALREGVMVFVQAGLLPGEALDELIDKVKELDMDEIREEIAKAGEDECEEPEEGQV